MWTAQILETNIDPVNPTASVVFTDNVKYKRVEVINLNGMDVNSFNARVESMRKGFETSFAFIDTIDPKTFVLTPNTQTPPTQADLDKQQFFADFRKLQQLPNLISLQIVAGTEKEWVDLQNKVKAEYKPEYFA